MSIVGLVFMQSPAFAGHGDISVPLNTFVQASEGEVVQLASVSVDPELVGDICNWEFHATNQESVHLGNDLILSTDGNDTVVPGVEDAPHQVLDVAGSFQLGETLTVSLRMGPDEVFSAGLTVEVVCDGDETPSTATTTPASATPATTPASATPATTTAAPASTPTTTADVAPEVAGEVITAEPVAPVAAAQELAVTGPSSSAGPLLAYAVFLLLGGIGLLVLGNRALD